MLSWWHKLEQWLLWVDVPGDASLSGVEGSVRNPWAVALTFLFVAVSAALILVMYFFESRRLGIIRRLFLAAVRTAVVGVLFFLLFRPLLLVAVFKGERPRGVALMLDNTESMKQDDRRLSSADKVRVAMAKNLVPFDTDLNSAAKLPSGVPDRPTRLELVKDVLAHPKLELRNNLAHFGPMRTFVFGTAVHRIDEKGTDPLGDALTGNEPRTALADGINEVLLRGDGDLPAAIVLITDGGDNASKTSLREVARECKRLGVPLHIYGVGSAEAGTLQLRDVTVPDVLFADDEAAIPVRWKALGMKKNDQVEVIVKLGDKELAHKFYDAKDGDDVRETVTIKPPKGQSKDERLDLVTTIRLKGSTDFKDEIKKPARLVDRKIKLLYIENSPRWVYKFLQMNLPRDKRVEASYLLVQGDEKAMASGPPYIPTFPATRKELFAYDMLIIGDVPAAYFGPEHMQWIADFVKEGGGLIHFAGRQNAPATWRNTPLEALLPFEFEPARFDAFSEARPQVFQPLLTPTGERHDLMALKDTREENLQTWRDLPGLYWHYPVTKLRAGGYTLLAHPSEKCKNSDELMPLVSLQYAGKGLVICLTIEEMWRWRLNEGDKVDYRFFGQAIYLAGLSHSLGSKQTQLMLDRSEIVMGRPIQVFARLFDGNFQPLIQKSVTAKLIEHLDSGENREQMVELLPVSGQPGEYRATLPNDRAGRFELKTQNGDNAGALEYRVTLPPKHELAVIGLAKEPLEEAAAASGGAFYREENLGDLVKNIKPQSAPFTLRQPLMPLNPLAFLIFVMLITVEWVVRKFSNLS